MYMNYNSTQISKIISKTKKTQSS